MHTWSHRYGGSVSSFLTSHTIAKKHQQHHLDRGDSDDASDGSSWPWSCRIYQDHHDHRRNQHQQQQQHLYISLSSYSFLSSSTFYFVGNCQLNLPIFIQAKTIKNPQRLAISLKFNIKTWQCHLPPPKKKLGREILLHFGLTFLITLWVRVVLANLRGRGMNSGHIIQVPGPINSSSHLY